MIVCVAMDSFKGSLSQKEAGEAVRDGVLRAFPDAEVRLCPMADGGEGTAEVLMDAFGGEKVFCTVPGPIGEPVEAWYTVVPKDGEKLCIIEMAAACGLYLVPQDRRDVFSASTCGLGELILHAAEHSGCRRFLIGIGGSATNDCGAGMLRALGYSFPDADGNETLPGCRGLADVCGIWTDGVSPSLCGCSFTVICDVDNPLIGDRGCSAVYAPQKGAKPQDVPVLDGAVRHFASVVKQTFPNADPDLPGSGAAGGLGFAFRTFLSAALCPGAIAVATETGLAEKIRGADLVICGEGKIDAQTAMGKAPAGVAKFAAAQGVPAVAIGGCVTDGARDVLDAGIAAYFPCVRKPCSLREAMEKENAYASLRDTAEQVMRVYGCGNRG